MSVLAKLLYAARNQDDTFDLTVEYPDGSIRTLTNAWIKSVNDPSTSFELTFQYREDWQDLLEEVNDNESSGTSTIAG